MTELPQHPSTKPTKGKGTLPNWILFWLETLVFTIVFGLSLTTLWAGMSRFEDWDHVVGWYEGNLDLDGYIYVDPARYTVTLSPQDIAEHRFSPQTLQKIEAALLDAGLAVVTGGSIWTDTQLQELDDMTYGELARAKKAAVDRGLTRPPWLFKEWAAAHEADQDTLYDQRYQEIDESGFCGDCVPHVKKQRIHEELLVDPMVFPKDNFSFSDAVSISYGRVDMPHFLNFTTFQESPYYNRSDMNELCVSYGNGDTACETTLAGALWNFPGSVDLLWHQDAAQEGHYEGHDEVTGTLTTAIASRQLPADVGWILFQPLTHDRGEFPNLEKGEPPNRGEPAPVTIPLNRGEMLIFTDTTKHTVTPNPTSVDRGIVYVLYGSQEWEDTPWHGNTPLIFPHLRAEDPLWQGPIDSRNEIPALVAARKK